MRTSSSVTLLLLLYGRAVSLCTLSARSPSLSASTTIITPGLRCQRVPIGGCSLLNRPWNHRPQSAPNRRFYKRNMNVLKEGSNNDMELEVEQKFALPNTSSVAEIERKLASLGFERVGQKAEFTDWYFDLPAPHWSLTLQDCWFRYREVKIGDKSSWGWKGSWQLKRGRQIADDGSSLNAGGGATVYEEIEGQGAIDAALSMLSSDKIDLDECKIDNNIDAKYEGFDIPHLGEECALIPFARFETRRTCWAVLNFQSTDSDFVGLTVELDGTNFGYMVGEVETIVYSEDKVANAKDRVAKLVSKLGSHGEGNLGTTVPTAGKLETYMIEHRRDHYDACIKAGVMGSGP